MVPIPVSNSLSRFSVSKSGEISGTGSGIQLGQQIVVVGERSQARDLTLGIAQVAEDDDISLQWFEEGRSDRVDSFWKDRSEELGEVHEEMAHEQLVEEIDQLDEEGKRGNALRRLRSKIAKDKD